MKKVFIIIILLFALYNVGAQEGPQLQLTGNSAFVKKGTIDTELLTAIIQKKQEEIKQRVFRNTIIRYFQENSYTESLNNFTTYNYLYNLMDILTGGKNKTVMTKTLMRNSADFAFVYGLTYYLDNMLINESVSTFKEVERGKRKEINKDVIYLKRDAKTDSVFEFNIRIDLTYKLLLEMQDKFANYFTFENSTENKYFEEWQKHDNKYDARVEWVTNRINVLNNKSNRDNNETQDLNDLKAELINLKDILNSRRNEIQSFLILVNKLEDAYEKLKDKLTVQEKEKKELLEAQYHLQQDYLFDTGANNQKYNDVVRLDKAINSLEDDLKNNLVKNTKLSAKEIQEIVKDQIEYFKEFYSKNKEEIKNILDFFNQIKKSNFNDFSLTKDQYDAMKFILKEFISVARNKFDEKDVIASVLDFLLENTLVEFTDSDGLLVGENSDQKQDSLRGYLYIDVESLITAIDATFGSIKRKRWLNYVTPFVSMGTNYASFNGNNNLLSDGQGGTEDLNNLYFASEKIGIKFKLWNWKYTHSFESGEPIKYWFIDGNSWKRPQPQPLLSDVYLTAYGSGILYNLIDVKSEKEFNYAIAGFGAGVTFFNGLSLNISYASPIIDKGLNDWFWNFGLDIPILEYLGALSKKNN